MTNANLPQQTLLGVAQGQAPVLESLVAMNLDSLAQSGLDTKTYFLARVAALVAMGAAPVSYLVNVGLAAESGVTLQEAQGTLVAIAPVVGSARVAAAADNILRAFGFAPLTEQVGGG